MKSASRYCRFLLIAALCAALGAAGLLPAFSQPRCAIAAAAGHKSLHCCCGANCHCGPACCANRQSGSQQTPSPNPNPDREVRDLVQSLPVVAQVAEPTSDPQESLFFDAPVIGEPLARQTLLGQHTSLRV